MASASSEPSAGSSLSQAGELPAARRGAPMERLQTDRSPSSRTIETCCRTLRDLAARPPFHAATLADNARPHHPEAILSSRSARHRVHKNHTIHMVGDDCRFSAPPLPCIIHCNKHEGPRIRYAAIPITPTQYLQTVTPLPLFHFAAVSVPPTLTALLIKRKRADNHQSGNGQTLVIPTPRNTMNTLFRPTFGNAIAE